MSIRVYFYFTDQNFCFSRVFKRISVGLVGVGSSPSMSSSLNACSFHRTCCSEIQNKGSLSSFSSLCYHLSDKTWIVLVTLHILHVKIPNN